MKYGITGQSGFIGTHLYNFLKYNKAIEIVEFNDKYFDDTTELKQFVNQCDVIVHLAAMNRHQDENFIYETNMDLVKKLIIALEEENVTPHIIFSSSTQEEKNNLYGRSKTEGRILFENWAKKNRAKFTGLIIPNVFGPFGLPNYNSFIATFCYQLNNNIKPEINVDASVKLIYVQSLCEFIYNISTNENIQKIDLVYVPYDFESSVKEILDRLNTFKDNYLIGGQIPCFNDINDIRLFNTLTSYINYKDRYPAKFHLKSDNRGDFVEVLKTGIGGQFSFSTTKPGITRGNHFHTRKVERFAVIKGEAIIEIRKINSDEKYEFKLSGKEPSYIDMPVWYTHNITNVGEEDLYTLFWINEFYNVDDPDTFFELV